MSENSVTIKSDKAAYKLLFQIQEEIVNSIDTAMTAAKDDEEREILVALICAAARQSHENRRPKAAQEASA